MRFEAPEIVEVLARPQENEGGTEFRLVAAGDGVAYTREQSSAPRRVADVLWRRRGAVDEGIAERDEP